ncbi:hypothetical protein ACFSOZ_31595 [Mesorhizobium newzealandense]|uniref:Uncharacterized protein n=1 Tax=Mesorhizobium newzealandense TaxID=1300302 RepID=A0ABW4UKZ2_9HYPH
MFFSNRGRFHSIVTAAIAVAIVVIALKATWEVAVSNAEYSQEAEQATKEYADRTQESIASTCRDRDIPAFAKCVDEIVKATEEAKTAQRDLAAQRSMALWALGMLWATVASIAVTGIGIYFVWRTLDANTDAVEQARVANQIARDANEAQLRAYLLVKTIHAEYAFSATGEIVGVAIKLVVQNGGQTPAMNVGHNVRLSETFLGDPPEDLGQAKSVPVILDMQLHRVADAAPHGEIVVVDKTIPINMFDSFERKNGLSCNLHCHLQYKPVVSKDVKHLILNYWIRRDGSRGICLRVSRSGPNETT